MPTRQYTTVPKHILTEQIAKRREQLLRSRWGSKPSETKQIEREIEDVTAETETRDQTTHQVVRRTADLL
jgi:hypothetical protein